MLLRLLNTVVVGSVERNQKINNSVFRARFEHCGVKNNGYVLMGLHMEH